MTFDEFYHEVIFSYATDGRHQRLGQYFMNSLAIHNISLYRSIPVGIDCYYEDSMIPAFLEWLGKNWVE